MVKSFGVVDVQMFVRHLEANYSHGTENMEKFPAGLAGYDFDIDSMRPAISSYKMSRM
jgi:hypothetical protein